MNERKIVLEPRAALELLGRVTEGRSLVEAHAAARTIRWRPPHEEAVESPEEESSHDPEAHER